MRTLISTAFISLDGVVEAPGGEPGYRNSGWTFKSVEFLPEAEAVCDHVIIIHRGQIRASDRLEDLRGRRQTVRVTHTGPPLPDYGLPTPPRAAVQDGVTQVFAETAEAGGQIVERAVHAGRAVREMVTQAPTLEAVFMAITSGKEEAP